MAEEKREIDLEMTSDNLYSEEIFTDRRVGTIQRLTPVTKDGGPDKTGDRARTRNRKRKDSGSASVDQAWTGVQAWTEDQLDYEAANLCVPSHIT